MKERNDAQSRLERSVPLLGGKTTFREAYPQVCEIRVSVEATPPGFGRAETYDYSLEHPPGQFCPCPNPSCTEGGCDLGSFLYGMISRGECVGEKVGYCVGHERLGRRETRGCHYAFRIKAEIKYADGRL
jgi:hypothetical protein